MSLGAWILQNVAFFPLGLLQPARVHVWSGQYLPWAARRPHLAVVVPLIFFMQVIVGAALGRPR